jgi:hypothetical protein
VVVVAAVVIQGFLQAKTVALAAAQVVLVEQP